MHVGRALISAGVLLAAAVAVSACTVGSPTAGADPAPTAAFDPGSGGPDAAPEQTTFLAVIDGDTIETSAGTVRIIGIDTPERGECGHDEASVAIAAQLAPGDTVTLELPAGENDQDRHGRLIRYVTSAAGVDVGLLQVQSGNAVARYDSSDGYPAHPREADYHSAQLATLDPNGSVITVACSAAAAPLAPEVGRAQLVLDNTVR